MYRRISSQVGDHWRIPAVVCFCILFGDGLKWWVEGVENVLNSLRKDR
jgi:hypothetical protein